MRALVPVPFLFSMAAAQQPSIDVSTPTRILELDQGFNISVSGSGFYDETPDIAIYDNTANITSQVTVTLVSESRVDQNNDDILESYSGSFSVTFGSYDIAPDHTLVTEAAAAGPSGNVSNQDSSGVRSNFTVYVDAEVDWDEEVHVSVQTDRMAVQSQTLKVYLGTTDVTNQVSIAGPVTAFEALEAGTPPFVRYRKQSYAVDVSGLGEFTQRIHFVASGTSAAGGTTAGPGSSLPTGEVAPLDLTECQEAALKEFMDDLELKKESGTVTIGADAAEVQAAGEALQAALAAAGCSFPSKEGRVHAPGPGSCQRPQDEVPHRNSGG